MTTANLIEVSSNEAARGLSTLINRAAFGHERIVLTRRGKRLAAIVPVADLQRIEAATASNDPPSGLSVGGKSEER